MKRKIILLITISSCLFASLAQNCESKLKQAQQYEANKDFGNAAYYYQKIMKDCGDNYGDAKAKWKECNSKSKTTTKNNPVRNVPVKQPESGSISHTEMYFDADGKCLNNTCEVTLAINASWDVMIDEKCRQWMNVSRYGNSFLITCSSNNNREERTGEVIVYGEINETVKVHQESRNSLSKTKPQNNASPQTNENKFVTAKIVFEEKKAKPSFENTGSIIEILNLLNSDNSLGLQIEIPWCSNQKAIKLIKKYPMTLIEDRIKNIAEHFGSLGIANERISRSIKPIEAKEGDPECDCGYVKVINLKKEESK